jgi:hypothetical protein
VDAEQERVDGLPHPVERDLLQDHVVGHHRGILFAR